MQQLTITMQVDMSAAADPVTLIATLQDAISATVTAEAGVTSAAVTSSEITAVADPAPTDPATTNPTATDPNAGESSPITEPTS